MAQTHRDADVPSPEQLEFMRRLNERADGMKGKASLIAGGSDDEDPLAGWQVRGVHVVQMPPDEQGILRISIGGGQTPVPLNYCTFRGDHAQCVDLLRKALRAMEAGGG